MPTAKRKASASPAASDTNDDPAELEIDQPLDDDLVEAGPSSPHKRANVSSSSSLQTLESDLRNLPLDILEPLLPLQKRRCLGTLVGSLPPVPAEPSQPIASTSTLAADEDEDAAVFTDQAPYKDVDEDARLQAAACVGLEEEWHTLHGMLHATVKAQESNSCLLIGASGSGKSLLVDSVLESIRNSDSSGTSTDDKLYYHVHLAGTVQINDRSAMKEMAQQLILQGAFTEEDVGDAIDAPNMDDEDEDGVQSRTAPAGDHVFGGDADDEEEDEAAQLAAAAAAADEQVEIQDELAGAILSSLNNIIAHIIALLSNTSSNADSNTKAGRKPLIITLDDFDLFTARPRQAMLYCLLDAVQAASYGAGLAVVGLTSRVDTVDLLEKRVKSRFSHRILHVRPPATYEIFERIVRNALAPLSLGSKALASIPPGHVETFVQAWRADFNRLFSHQHFRDVLRGVYELSNDIRMIYRILIPTISSLTLLSPSIDLPSLLSTAATEVSDGIIHILRDLTEPELALLIAIKHLQTRDRQIFNFEMCYDELRRFASRDARERQAASSAEGGTAGGGGGVAVSTPFFADRKIALMSFHSLLSLEIVLPENWVSTLTVSNPVAKPSAAPGAVGRSNQSTIRKEFWKVRCILPPQVIVTAVKDRQRQVAVSSSLVKWATSHG
ncbi:Origin recognition complex subunit 4 [Pseudozyma hubeiensis]|nr:Origin recognition complex subunit 4 [Pseudozyma hubeiensis]